MGFNPGLIKMTVRKIDLKQSRRREELFVRSYSSYNPSSALSSTVSADDEVTERNCEVPDESRCADLWLVWRRGKCTRYCRGPPLILYRQAGTAECTWEQEDLVQDVRETASSACTSSPAATAEQAGR
ncbi:hypothetical protein KM043_018294 [Ampulex compressa]|nr:hypothetical protein KM043_018294 [Ampulex compressa]